jgi:hypothetical protein
MKAHTAECRMREGAGNRFGYAEAEPLVGLSGSDTVSPSSLGLSNVHVLC